MACCDSITDLAQNIFYDLGQPSGQPPSYIQSRLASASYVGQLNNLLGSCYAPISGCLVPELSTDDAGIYSIMYQHNYYTTKLNQTLAGLSPGAISISDGDSKITFVNPVEQAKVYKDMSRQLYEQLLALVYANRQQNSQPSSVNMPLIENGLNGAGDGGVNGEIALRGYYRS